MLQVIIYDADDRLIAHRAIVGEMFLNENVVNTIWAIKKY